MVLPAGKKLRSYIGADIGNARRCIILTVGKKTTTGNIAVLDVCCVCRGARYEHIFKQIAVTLYL